MIDGPSGSGKTMGSQLIAQGLGGKVAVIDTENGSASLYADKFGFDVCDISAPFAPEKYIQAINDAEKDYDVLIIDSISHEWNGQGGCLEIKENLGESFRHWGKVTPRHNAFINAIINSKIHIISTVRTKTGYEMGSNNGKQTVTKIGLQPITRDGFEYENTIVFTLNENNFATSKKDRTSLFNGKNFKITKETGEELLGWLNDGKEPPKPMTAEESRINKLVHDLKTAFGDGKMTETRANKIKETIKAEKQDVKDLFNSLYQTFKNIQTETDKQNNKGDRK